MKVTKSLLLGAAAGLVAMSGAQAADLPVKAKAVEYVKICSAYGAGFYYIPGTDICLRVGGYVFLETGLKAFNGASERIYDDATFNRSDNYTNWRARGMVILDARTNTAYGTLRSYAQFGVSYQDNRPGGNAGAPNATNTVPSLDRAFIQFAGFTAGFTGSFFEFAGWQSVHAVASVPWDWLPLLAYTAQLGNGVSATVSIEDSGARRSGIATGTFGGMFAASVNYGGQMIPDIIANVRVDQSWGSAQIMGALHHVRLSSPLAATGAPDKWGYAFGGGFRVKTPQTGNPNNNILVQAQYTKGAIEYTGLNSSPVTTASGLGLITGATGPVADLFDAWVGGGQTFLTEAWSAYAGYKHYWTPALWSSIAFGYTDLDPGGSSVTAAGGDPDVRVYQIIWGNQWTPAPGLDLSLDLVYSNVKTGPCQAGAIATCSQSEGIFDVWTRWRRNF